MSTMDRKMAALNVSAVDVSSAAKLEAGGGTTTRAPRVKDEVRPRLVPGQ